MPRVTPLATDTISTFTFTLKDGKVFRWTNWRDTDIPLVWHSGRIQVVCSPNSRLTHYKQMRRILDLDVPQRGRPEKFCIPKTLMVHVLERTNRAKLLHFPRWKDIVFADGPRSERSQQELTSALELWKTGK